MAAIQSESPQSSLAPKSSGGLISRIVNHWRVKRMKHHIRVFPSQLTRIKYGLPTIALTDLSGSDRDLAPAILDDLCLPNHAGSPGHNDFRPLLQILKARQPELVIELGTAHGNTTANICRQCPDAKVVTVNALHEQISGDLITFALSKDAIGRVFRAHGFEGRVTQVYANTLHLDLEPYLGRETADLAIIDACHDTPFVLNDFAKIVDFIKPGGLVLLHDTHPSMEEHLVGSYRACMTLRRKDYDIRHLADTWWGVWEKPKSNG